MRKSLLFSVAFGLIATTGSIAREGSSAASVTSLLLDNVVQNIIKGRVTSADGAISGATVSIVGGTTSVSTDDNGNFSINAPIGATLRFSYVGYQSRDIAVSGSVVNVVLSVEDNPLEEVVVVGYGTQKRGHVTGAVTNVSMDRVVGDRPVPDLARGLQGTVPGLNIQVPSGEVGSDAIMKIRGQVGSPNGGSNPLILVDNVEIPSIQYVNPHDVESITVLKDAASSAIYGAKAAFGVILITTKKGGTTDKTTFTYSNNLILQSPFKKIDVAGIDGLEYTLDAHENMKQPGPAGGFWRIDRNSFEKMKEWQEKWGSIVGDTDPVVYGRDWWWDGTQKFGYRIYDPVKAMVKDNAFSNIHNLGMNGRSGKTNYNLSVGYMGQEGMMKPAINDDFQRFTGTLTLSHDVNDFLTLRGGARYADSRKRNPFSLNSGGFGADPWLYLYRWSRLFPVDVQENGIDIIDPAFSARNSHDQIHDKRFLNLNFGTTIKITKNWDVVADYAYNTENTNLSQSLPYVQAKTTWYGVQELRDENGNRIHVDENGVPVESGGMPAWQFPLTDHTTKEQTHVYRDSYLYKRHTLNALTNYNLDMGNHDIKFMLGTNIVAYAWEGHWSQRSNLINNENPQLNWGVGTETSGGGANWDSQVGFFGRVNYAYKDKYLVEANLRYDGSSKFPKHLQWRWFPGISAGWIVSEERFMESLNPVLSFARLRASYGVIGDQSVPNSIYVPTMGITKNSWLNAGGEQFFQLGTPGAVSRDITWQDIEHLNVGLDLRFFNNKLGFTTEWYQRYTRNMIVGGDFLPATFGTGVPPGNYGHLRTRGWEIAADFNHRFDNGLGLTFHANMADAVTFITKGADWQLPWEDRSLGTTYSTGRRYGDVFGFVTDRLFQADDFVYDESGNFLQTDIVWRGTSKRTNVLAGDNPVYQTYFEDGNQILLISPGDVKFVDVNGDGYIDAGSSTNGDPGDRVVIGNITPRYDFGFRVGADWKGFDLSVFFQGVGKRSIWGDGQLAIPGYFSKEGAMPQVIAGDYWKPDRTDAFYPRAWNMNGSNSNYVMRPQSKYMLDMSYLKIKNITVGYNLPSALLSKARIANARIYVSLENFITFDNLRGLPIDPEAISGHSMLREGGNYNLGRTGTSNPPFKSASMGISIGF
ncbi:SusC/RagA family TonB-linked outer membrane protein [Sphingobacterium gobiense]|uniref:SusC/RagA family protein n=1 Tax=Sphingobacterium gobiense TaxID=1382456 RepID=A0A2S9JD26_9SPHI|nr:TonB-dependent receptor [Sphingobacterium gobiense]PRD50778.1 SusC/RagA family protein [Sphingobacterium gobiense]